jgi:RNA polymerase sigma factor (sigma-70 family)
MATLALLRTQSDARLAALARDGHERAYEAIVERYRRELLRHAQRVVSEARAEDVLQHALLAAWAALRRGDEVRDLRPWLHRIVHNTSLNALRGGRDEYAELRESMQVGDAPEDEIERRAIVRDTLEALAALPERQREALLRVAVQGRSQEEVAEDFGLSHGAVRQLVHRARSTLRAAATAVTPLPVASWLASVGTRAGEPAGARIAELVSDSGSAGLASALAKAGVVVVLAGGAAAGPAIVEHSGDRDTARAADAPTQTRSSARDKRPASTAPSAPPAVLPAVELRREETRTAVSRRSDSRHRGSSGSRHRGSGRDDEDDDADRSGPRGGGGSSGSSGSDGSNSGPGGGGSSGSGSGSGESGQSGSGSSGSGSGSDDGHSGSGSGSGSGGSGSGTSGSGSSGSDSSGSGSSGSGSSGSGSSGSDSSGPGSGETTAPIEVEPETSGGGSDSSGSGSSGSGSTGSGSSGSGSGSDPDHSGTG